MIKRVESPTKYALYSLTLFLFLISIGCFGSDRIISPDTSVGLKSDSKFVLKSFLVNGQEVTAESELSFSPDEKIKVEASYSLGTDSKFSAATIILSFVTFAESTRTVAGECNFQANEGVNGKNRVLKGELKMPPEHMVEFMSNHAKTSDFSFALKDGPYVLGECRVRFKQ